MPGHYRKAHRGRFPSRPGRVQARFVVHGKPVGNGIGLVPVASLSDAEIVARFGRRQRPERPEPIRPEVVDVTPSRTEIVLATRPVPAPKRSPRNVLTPDLREAERPPSWWEPGADPGWRLAQWNTFSADYRNRVLAQRAGAAFTIRAPQATDATVLWSQYYALKALAVRLDAGVATERERVSFVAGLREYNANFDRIAQRKVLSG